MTTYLINSYTLFSSIITLAMFIGYINHRFIRLSPTIAIMSASLVLSLILIICEHLGITNIKKVAQHIVADTDFRHLLLNGMLSFLLFAGSLSLNIRNLRQLFWPIVSLATMSTVLSCLIIGFLSYYISTLLQLNIPLLYCFLFGALISPTDPIAVLAMLKKFNTSQHIKSILAGESLFNDGVGIVLFLSLAAMISTNHSFSFEQFSLIFFRESIGGLIYGFILGHICAWMIHSVEDIKIRILITLAIVTGGYTFAQFINISGPLAMVMAGIIVNTHLTKYSDKNNIIHIFWEIIDDILNAILFMLIGFEILVIPISGHELLATLILIPVVLMVRFITVALPMKCLKKYIPTEPHAITTITWGGLRGGLAVALALSIPDIAMRNSIVAFTYGIVAFSILIQGGSMPLLFKSKRNS